MPLDDLEKMLHTRRLRWQGHVERSDGWLKKSRNSITLEVVAVATLKYLDGSNRHGPPIAGSNLDLEVLSGWNHPYTRD